MGRGTFLQQSQQQKTISKKPIPTLEKQENHEAIEPPLFTILTTYFTYLVLIVTGHLRELFSFKSVSFDTFYRRWVYTRIRDTFNRPISNIPGRHVDLIERISDDFNLSFLHTSNIVRCLNLGSYSCFFLI